MRNASQLPRRDGFICEHCGRFCVTAIDGVFSNPKVGSVRRFCDPACRQAAWRRRQAGVAENTPRQQSGGRRRRLQSRKSGPLNIAVTPAS